MRPGRAATLSLAQLQHRLLATLLAAQPHSARELLDANAAPLAPRHVREIEDFLVAHPQAEVTPEALAERAGVSVRSLFLGFQKHRGVSPMKLLRELRLHRVRDELLLAAPGTTVTDVALHWGFFHLGRFSTEYRSAFGEPPSRTLTRQRHKPA
jgi:transcriptional regulator GlxA family with amidase domain